MYLNYDWEKYPLVIEFLDNIYFNTLKKLNCADYDVKYAQEFISDIEDYLYYFKIHDFNINNIIYKLADIEVIEFYDSLVIGETNDDFNFPPAINQCTRILLNSNIEGNKRLTARERRKLYLYQGLSHSLISMKNTKTVEFSKIFSTYLTTSRINVEAIVNNGWLLIEDTLAQELAEKITYFALDKIRPQYSVGLEKEVFPISGSKISSNLEMNRVFQPLVVNFGLTIGRIANYYDYSEAMITNDLLRYAISDNLSNMIIAEYNEKGNHLELYRILYLMGLLVNEMYHNYHMGFVQGLYLDEKEYNTIFENILELTNRLVSFEKSHYDDMELSNIVYDLETKEKVLKLVRYHEI